MKNQEGFSLVEVLIASTLLGILALFVFQKMDAHNLNLKPSERRCLSWRDEVIYENGESRVVQLCNEYSNF